jgi:hypothetical protein
MLRLETKDGRQLQFIIDNYPFIIISSFPPFAVFFPPFTLNFITWVVNLKKALNFAV